MSSGCIFSTGSVSNRFCNPANELFRQQNRNILENTGNLYPAWTVLRTTLKLVPLLGCQTHLDLAVGSDGKTGIEKEVEYFGRLNAKYTIRITGSYLDSQPTFWANPNQQPNSPIEIAPRFGFWSVVDRYKPSFALFPTYNVVPGSQGRIENLTVSIATAGQSGWGCPEPTYCPDDALRYGGVGANYATLAHFMALARQLRPKFLIVDQFNEFTMSDEGWNAETSDDAEPTFLPQGWGFTGIQAIHEDISLYRRGL